MGTSDLGTGALGDGLGYFLDFRAGDQKGDVNHVVAESLDLLAYEVVQNWTQTPYRIGSDVNALLLAVLNQIVALQNGVAFNLVGGGHNTGGVDDGLKLWDIISKPYLSC